MSDRGGDPVDEPGVAARGRGSRSRATASSSAGNGSATSSQSIVPSISGAADSIAATTSVMVASHTGEVRDDGALADGDAGTREGDPDLGRVVVLDEAAVADA